MNKENIKLSIKLTENKEVIEIQFGYFSDTITVKQSKLMSDIIFVFKNGDCSVYSFIYVFEDSRWNKARRLGAKFIHKKVFSRKAIFPRIIQYEWAIVECCSRECLQEVILTEWNLSGNESFIIVLNKGDIHVAHIEKEYKDNVLDSPDNEFVLIDDYPYVFSRDHDGIALRLFTSKFDKNYLLKKIRQFAVEQNIELELVDNF